MFIDPGQLFSHFAQLVSDLLQAVRPFATVQPIAAGPYTQVKQPILALKA